MRGFFLGLGRTALQTDWRGLKEIKALRLVWRDDVSVPSRGLSKRKGAIARVPGSGCSQTSFNQIAELVHWVMGDGDNVFSQLRVEDANGSIKMTDLVRQYASYR